jgi:hypothetical protein
MNIRRICRFLSNRKLLRYFYAMSYDGYLVESGWIRSFLEGRPVDREGRIVPWVTHAFTAFFTPRLKSNMKLLEFGAGFSTLFYSGILESVTSIESNVNWFHRIKSQVDTSKVNLMLFEGPKYWQCMAELDRVFDIVIVDGDHRFECAQTSLNYLSPSGVIVLDNSNRPAYQPIYDLLTGSGFRYLDFFGLAPGHRKANCTTVFYRDSNCLGI